jgi:hypothetical protein
MCVRGIDFVFFYNFSIDVWYCSDSVVFIVVLLLLRMGHSVEVIILNITFICIF